MYIYIYIFTYPIGLRSIAIDSRLRQAIFERDEDLQRIFASPDGLSTEALTMERYAVPRRTVRGATWDAQSFTMVDGIYLVKYS